jgi:hypothetical protein
MTPFIKNFFNAIAIVLFVGCAFFLCFSAIHYFQDRENRQFQASTCKCLTEKKVGKLPADHKCSNYEDDFERNNSQILHPCEAMKLKYDNSRISATLAGILFIAAIGVLLFKKFLFVFKNWMKWLFS